MVSGNGNNWPVRMVVIWNNFGDVFMQANSKTQKSEVFCVESHWVVMGPLFVMDPSFGSVEQNRWDTCVCVCV